MRLYSIDARDLAMQGTDASLSACADVFFKVQANYSIPHHWHSSSERMVLVSGELHVTYDGHATTVLTPGMCASGPAAAPH